MIGISVKDFGISFGSTLILDEVSFEVKQGEIVTILGPSGCGKSTILRSIASLQDEYTGDIFINEHCLIKNGKRECHKDIGYIFQDYALFPHLNVKENIEFALYKMNKLDRQRKVDSLLKQFDLVEHRNKQIHELSGGQQQRVSIARVMAYEPKVILLDEPFSNLDTLLRNKTKVWLKKLIKDMGLSAILVTHDQKEALSMSDKIAIIHDKTLEQFGTPKELFEEPKSFYVANFLNKINELPDSLLQDLRAPIRADYVGVVSIDKVKLTKDETKIKGTILDISFCGDYYELHISLDDYENKELLVKSNCLDHLCDEENCFVDISLEDIKIVKRSI